MPLQNISNQINWRRSQTSILFIKFIKIFFTEKQYIKTSIKIPIKVSRIVGTLSRMRSRMSITVKCIFSGEFHLWLLLQKGNTIFVTLIHINKNYHTSMYFLRKIIFHFRFKKYHIFWKKTIPSSFQIMQERSIPPQSFLEKPSVWGIWRKYHTFIYFFEKYHLSFPF